MGQWIQTFNTHMGVINLKWTNGSERERERECVYSTVFVKCYHQQLEIPEWFFEVRYNETDIYLLFGFTRKITMLPFIYFIFEFPHTDWKLLWTFDGLVVALTLMVDRAIIFHLIVL